MAPRIINLGTRWK